MMPDPSQVRRVHLDGKFDDRWYDEDQRGAAYLQPEAERLANAPEDDPGRLSFSLKYIAVCIAAHNLVDEQGRPLPLHGELVDALEHQRELRQAILDALQHRWRLEAWQFEQDYGAPPDLGR